MPQAFSMIRYKAEPNQYIKLGVTVDIVDEAKRCIKTSILDNKFNVSDLNNQSLFKHKEAIISHIISGMGSAIIGSGLDLALRIDYVEAKIDWPNASHDISAGSESLTKFQQKVAGFLIAGRIATCNALGREIKHLNEILETWEIVDANDTTTSAT